MGHSILYSKSNTLNAGYCLKYSHTSLPSFDIILANLDYHRSNKKLVEDTLIAIILFELTLMKHQCIAILISMKEETNHLINKNYKIWASLSCSPSMDMLIQLLN